MFTIEYAQITGMLLAAGLIGAAVSPAEAALRLEGQVQAGGGPVANSTVTLWAASEGEPKQLAQGKTGDDGSFALNADATPGPGVSLYLVAKGGVAAVKKGGGDNPALAFLTVLGGTPPAKVVVNEMTTIASVWTNAQFLDGAAIKGPALSLSIAAGNVPNFVDLETGGLGTTIQNPTNSAQTPTLAIFGTLGDLLAACTTEATADACGKLFAATTPPGGVAPTDTLQAAQAIARDRSHETEKLFALIDVFYPAPKGMPYSPAPYKPYLSRAPGAWILGLSFTGGGLVAPGKIAFDKDGNAWAGANWIVGSQENFALWNGALAEFAPNGRPLSPMTSGFTGGGVYGPGFGTAVAADGKVWIGNYSGKSVSVFDKDGVRCRRPRGSPSAAGLASCKACWLRPTATSGSPTTKRIRSPTSRRET